MSALARPVRDLDALRQLLVERYPDARPLVSRDPTRLVRPVATGIAALDLALPHGGFPRGQLTVWAPGGGAAAVLRAACRAVVAEGERAAWVQATPTRSFGFAGPPAALPLLVQPGDRLQALRATALLLHAAAFALVVLQPAGGTEPIGTETVRLVRAARAGGTALVVLTSHGALAALRMLSTLDVRGVRWRHGPHGPAAPATVSADVRARALGWNTHARLTLVVPPLELRDALAPAPDRRGGAPSAVDGGADDDSDGRFPDERVLDRRYPDDVGGPAPAPRPSYSDRA